MLCINANPRWPVPHHPRVILDRPEEKTGLNPVKRATVVAQADIVGVQAPWRVPERGAKKKTKPFPKLDYLDATVSDLSVEDVYDTHCQTTHAGRSTHTGTHTLLKLGDGAENELLLPSLLSLPQPLLGAFAVPLLAVFAPLVALYGRLAQAFVVRGRRRLPEGAQGGLRRGVADLP